MNFIEVNFDSALNSVLFFVCVFIVSNIGVFLYRKIATRFKILASPNFRTLHKFPVPRGGGIVFSLIFVIGVFVFWYVNLLSLELLLILGFGGLAATLFGFIDDVYNISASRKLLVQICLSIWILYWLGVGTLLHNFWLLGVVIIPLLIFFIVWMINAYNFMDGIDGMAASGAIFISLALTVVLFLTKESIEIMAIFILISATVSGFMFFNWPPATIFMGDAGSIFLGYIFGSLMLFTVLNSDISIWIWVTVLGYFFADTTVTQIMRVILVKKWYLAHRSHAYQNLARITGSHLKVTGAVTLYNIIWIFPLVVWSVLQPEIEVVAAILAVIPAMIVTYKYGPLLSSS